MLSDKTISLNLILVLNYGGKNQLILILFLSLIIIIITKI